MFSCTIGADGSVADTGGARLFPYWSFTKTAIAVCALRLAADARLELDAPLAPEGYTLRHLLGHRSGLPDYGALAAYHRAVKQGEPPWPRDVLLREGLGQGRLFAPGTGWAYSNIGYMIAREHIEQVAGQPLAEMVRSWVTEPLGLRSVELAATRSQFDRIFWTDAKRYDPGWVYPGCLIGTAADAARLLDALLRGRLLPHAWVERMRITHRLGGALPGRPWTKHGYGLGLMSGHMGAAGRALGHSGAGPFCVNAVYHFPELPCPVTVATFTDGTDEGVAEAEACALATTRH
jgi:CubicO group peptidase (beta-lactamase class C family)